MEGRQRMTLSGVVVLYKATDKVGGSLLGWFGYGVSFILDGW
jgi:hypothetical protein